MPVQTRSGTRSATQPETKTEQKTPTLMSEQTPDEIWNKYDYEASKIDSDKPVHGPLADDEEWTVAYVKFKTQLLNRPLDLKTRHLTTFRWWIRFRSKTDWWNTSNPGGDKSARERVKELVRAQCSPPLEYQKNCDYCHVFDPVSGYCYLPYYVHDDDFLDIEFLPPDMDTSDDDEHARILAPKTIEVVEKLKACRNAHPSKTTKKQVAKVENEQKQTETRSASRRMTRSQAAKFKAWTGYNIV